MRAKRYIRDGWIGRLGILLLSGGVFACSTERSPVEIWPSPDVLFAGPFGARAEIKALRGHLSADRVEAEVEWRDRAPAVAGWSAVWQGPTGSGPELRLEGEEEVFRIEGARPEAPGRHGLELCPPEDWRLQAPWESRAGDHWVMRTLAVPGQSALPHLSIPWTPAPPALDGRLDEAPWQVPGVALQQVMGGSVAEDRQTTVRLAWDEEALYVAFEALDPEISERFAERDDPIYEHEAVELFLMPRRDGPYEGPYFELQASPGGVRFDASFVGPRRGMDRSFDPPFEVGTTIHGSLDGKPGDQKWISEWRIPWSSLEGGPGPEAGEIWRANLFRIDRSRGRPDDYQAWSPPLAGDFHRTKRFGFLEFGDRP